MACFNYAEPQDHIHRWEAHSIVTNGSYTGILIGVLSGGSRPLDYTYVSIMLYLGVSSCLGAGQSCLTPFERNVVTNSPTTLGSGCATIICAVGEGTCKQRIFR